MTRDLYRRIAKKNGVSVEEVKREMQAAIDVAYESPNYYARRVERKNEKPTTDEFIKHVVFGELV